MVSILANKFRRLLSCTRPEVPEMSEKLIKIQLNTLKILEWEPEYPTYSDKNLSPELLLERLCHLGVPSDMPAFRKRYAEVSKYDQHLRIAVDEPKIRENLYGPLRQAKMNYILGNYAGSIALCGIVAEMITILVYMLQKPSNNKLKCFVCEGQHKRIEILKSKGLIDQQSKNDFERIRAARNSLVHRWNTPDERIASNAVEIYATTARLAFQSIFVKQFHEGKPILPPELMNYLEEQGATVQREEVE